MRRFFHLAHLSAGFIAVLVGYTSSAAIVFQAATAAGAEAAHLASWLLALGLGMGATCIGLSLRYRSPVLTAWSTPGAALLGTALIGVPMGEAVGAFLFASTLMAVLGFTGGIEHLIKRVPKALAAATSYAYVNPVVAVLLGIVFAGEQINAAEWLAMAVILAAVLLIGLPQWRAQKRAAE